MYFIIKRHNVKIILVRLEGQGVLVRGWVGLELHPVSTFTPLGHSLKKIQF